MTNIETLQRKVAPPDTSLPLTGVTRVFYSRSYKTIQEIIDYLKNIFTFTVDT